MGVTVLSEIRISEEGQPEEVGASYTFLRYGRPKVEQRDADLVVGCLSCLPQGISERLMALRLPFWGGEFAIVLSVCGLPMTNYDGMENKFYEDLHTLLVSAPTLYTWHANYTTKCWLMSEKTVG
nr:unnamed protein product [Spirometra erinaceieuropaei]